MNRITQKIRKGLEEVAIVGALAFVGYTTGSLLTHYSNKYFPEERFQENTLKSIWPELDFDRMNWTKYLLIR